MGVEVDRLDELLARYLSDKTLVTLEGMNGCEPSTVYLR